MSDDVKMDRPSSMGTWWMIDEAPSFFAGIISYKL